MTSHSVSPLIDWAIERFDAAVPVGASRPSLLRDSTLGHEGFRLSRASDGALTVAGGDEAGIAYGLTELADRVRHAPDGAAALARLETEEFRPRTPVRGMLRTFSSDVLDLPWFRSTEFWDAYLDELAVNRINRFQLALGMQYNYSHDLGVVDNYFCFAYPFLIDVPGYDISIANVDAGERAANLAALRYIGEQCERRGIDFQLGLWNHSLHVDLGEAGTVRYRIAGLAESGVAEYVSEALPLLLNAVPSIKGITLRVHYEGGVPEAGREEFWGCALSGLPRLDHRVKVDIHSKGVNAELLDLAEQKTGLPVQVSAKYWAEHMGLPYHQTAVREMEKARPDNGDALRGITQNARRFTRYGYGDFLAYGRSFEFLFRVWPGTQRFLLSADPGLLSGYAREATLGGSVGAEWCEPLSFRGRKNSGIGNRDLYRDDLSNALHDWKKYRYFYRLAGRLMYDPQSDPSQWRRYLVHTFGAAAAGVEDALSSASRILPLVTTALGMSASNNFFWPEAGSNFPLAGGAGVYDFDTAEPRAWRGISPFDPEIFDTTLQYVDGVKNRNPSGRYTPLEVAEWLDRLAHDAGVAIQGAERDAADANDAELVRVAIDVRIQAALGRYYAARLRAGVRHARFVQDGQRAELVATIDEYGDALAAFTDVIEAADGVYADELGFGDRTTERGHWIDRRLEIHADIAALRTELAELPVEVGTRAASLPVAEPRTDPLSHVPSDGYVAGEALRVEASGNVDGATLRYRRLNQGEDFTSARMRSEGGRFVAEIPSEIADGVYPLQYFFVVDVERGRLVSPGLGADLCQRPYHVVAARERRVEKSALPDD